MKLLNQTVRSIVYTSALCAFVGCALQGCGGGQSSTGAAVESASTQGAGTAGSSTTSDATQTLGAAPISSTPQQPAVPQIDVNQWNGKDVVIPKGTTVTLDANVTPTTVTVYGTLKCAMNRDLSISAKWILVSGGLFECGTPESPYNKKLTVTLEGAPSDESIAKIGTKVLGAVLGGQINIHGPLRKNWVRLAANTASNANQILVSEAVDWQPGDRIVIASSAIADESEERIIERISGNTIQLSSALKYSHLGEIRRVAGVDIDMRAEVGLLTHGIRIEGDEASVASQFGGHVMVAGKGSNARIQGVQFTRMGQFNRLGRYPMHWHHVRDANGGYFKNNSISHTLQRGLIVHATDNLMIEENVIYDTKGHSYGLENGSETGNTFQRNLGLATRNATLPNVIFENGDTADDHQAATYWLVAGNNTFIGNVAAGSESSGFWFERAGSVKLFTDNTAHSNAASNKPGTNDQAGITTKDSQGLTGVFKNSLLYANAVGAWFQTLDSVLLDSKLSDNRMATFSAVSLENTIVIGDSGSRTTATTSVNEGLVTYNSPVVVKNVTFANFVGYAMATFLGGPEGAKFKSEGLKFLNVADDRRIQLKVGNAYAVDVDGSLLGSVSVAVSDDPSMYTPECVAKPSLGLHICPGLLAYQSLFMGDPTKADTLTRDDGVQQSLGVHTPFFSVIGGRKYTVNRDLGNTNLWIDGADAFVEIMIPTGAGTFDIFACIAVGNCVDETRKLSPASNQLQLDQSIGDKYFYDPISGLLHLKVPRWKQLVIRKL